MSGVRPQMEGPGAAGEETPPDSRYQRYLAFVASQSALAAQGQLTLQPEGIAVGITEYCNFRCVGCYIEGIFKKTFMPVEDVERMLDNSNAGFTYISLTSGEAFLHPKFVEILEVCKRLHPTAKIDLVTNAGVSIKGPRRRAVSLIDSLGVSIDGATKKTYEEIRVGGNFERFLESVREIVAVRAETGNPALLEFDFTAMSKNIGELPGVVRIAAELGVPNVYFQPMEMREPEIQARIGQYNLNLMPVEDVYRITDEAMALGRELGVSVYGAGSMIRPAGEPAAADAQMVEAGSIEAVRTCQYFWTQPFVYQRETEHYVLNPCCYMPEQAARDISYRYGLVFDAPEDFIKVYNSPAYWQMRRDLACGGLDEFCGGCMQAQTHPWQEPA